LFSNREYQPWHDEVRGALERDGFIPGQNLELVYRYADGRDDLLDSMATDLVALGVDAIVVGSTPTIAAAMRATDTIPIVMAASADPIASGFVKSLSAPGGNVTGITSVSTEMAAKRLELLREAVPGLERLAVVYDPANEIRGLELTHTSAAAERFGIDVRGFPIRDASDLDPTFAEFAMWSPGAALAFSDASLSVSRTRFLALVEAHELPVMFERDQWVESGGLMSYGPSLASQYRRAGEMVAKILRGTKPKDIPVEIPPSFELTLNAQTANSLGIPRAIVARADRLVE
jgi:putative ABC transport system substrate-binding protein